MKSSVSKFRANMSPDIAIDILKKGNERFVNNIKLHRNLLKQVNETSVSQFPFATILSCIDSRTSAELIFDLGLGDIFSIRIAGNILNEDILGSMEFGCKVSGSKLIVVLGHTNCGAVIGACNNLSFGHLTKLLNKLKPAIESETETAVNRDGNNISFVYNVTLNNVRHTISELKKQSTILSDMERKSEIKIIGGIYDVETGKVDFLNEVQ